MFWSLEVSRFFPALPWLVGLNPAGVISGVGKGIIASSCGLLLKTAGLAVSSIKIDPYLNLDAGLMNVSCWISQSQLNPLLTPAASRVSIPTILGRIGIDIAEDMVNALF